jgi:hypothetical protein
VQVRLAPVVTVAQVARQQLVVPVVSRMVADLSEEMKQLEPLRIHTQLEVSLFLEVRAALVVLVATAELVALVHRQVQVVLVV